MLMFTLAARRRPKDRRTTGASAGVINMDDIAAERREGGGGRGSAAAREGAGAILCLLGSWDGSKLPCHGALNFIAFHSSRTRGDRAWQREGEEGGEESE